MGFWSSGYDLTAGSVDGDLGRQAGRGAVVISGSFDPGADEHVDVLLGGIFSSGDHTSLNISASSSRRHSSHGSQLQLPSRKATRSRGCRSSTAPPQIEPSAIICSTGCE